MTHHTATFQTVYFTTAVALEQLEAAVYRADAVFQAQVVTRVYHAGIVAAHIFIQATIHTYVSGVRCGRWYRNWFADYTAVPVVETTVIVEPQLAIAPGADAVVLALPAETSWHPDRAAAEERAMRQLCKTVMIHAIDALPGIEVLITPAPKVRAARKAPTETTGKPAPKARKTAGVAPRKAPTQAKVGTKTASID